MSIFEDTDLINDLLNRFAEDGTIEPMVEPIDDPDLMIHLDEWASVVGVADEFYPEYDDFQDDGSF
jgi:hypothetical protein